MATTGKEIKDMHLNASARAAHAIGLQGSGTLAGLLLRAGTAAALVIDAATHLQDAHFYVPNAGPLLNQGQLFQVQSVGALVLAAAVLAWPRRLAWVVAFVVAASACGAVVLYTYVNVGPLAGLPNMYEPSWGPPGKLVSAVAEGAGALLALGGLGWATYRRRHS